MKRIKEKIPISLRPYNCDAQDDGEEGQQIRGKEMGKRDSSRIEREMLGSEESHKPFKNSPHRSLRV